MQVADRFGLDRLKRLCELEMLHAINIDTAAHILYTADQHNAEVLYVLYTRLNINMVLSNMVYFK